MDNISYQFKMAGITTKLIVINVVCFLVGTLAAWILRTSPGIFMRWFVLPSDLGDLLLQPWGLFTYAFLHFGFWHIFWNMMLLHWFGQFALNLFTEKRFLTIYLLGGLAGGVLFVAAYNTFPVLTQGTGTGSLIGASAAVLSIVIFIATYTPYAEVRLFFITLKLWQIGLIMVLADLIQLPSQSPIKGNAGGLIAHLGGAAFGYLYATQLKKGNDIGAWFENLLDYLKQFFTPGKKPLKTVYKSKPKQQTTAVVKRYSTKYKSPTQEQIDAILDKISKSGYESLTKEEKDFLFKAGRD